MDAIKTILTRRSIRAFKKKKVRKEDLKKVLECGLAAPSSKNSQPWKFLVVQNPKTIRAIGEVLINSKNLDAEPSDPRTGKIREGFSTSIKASGEIIKGAPLLIIVENRCPFSGGRKVVMESKFRDRAIGGHDSEFLSIGAAMENICLAAHALGLATVIIADIIAEEEKIKKMLSLKGDLVVAIPVGYPAYEAQKRKVNKKLITFL